MEINNMTMTEVRARLAEIRTLIEGNDNIDADALTEEVRQLKERQRELENQAESRRRLMSEVEGSDTVIRNFGDPEQNVDERTYDASSPEYRTAWLKNLALDAKGNRMFGELTEVEERAFNFVTTNTPQVVPTEILDRIVELVDNDSPIYDDARKENLTAGFVIARHKSTDAGDAKKTGEGVANDDEQDTFDELKLPGVEIKKHITMSRQMQFQSISAFENWVVSHLAARIRVAKENYILEQLATTTAGMDAGNKVTGTALTDDEIRKVFALLRGTGARVLYANNNFIWNTLAGVKDEDGNKLFQPSSMVDPIIEGRVYGSAVKKDENIPDDTFYVGYPKSIIANEFIAFDITPQIEAKTLNRIFVGYSLFDAGLEDPKAFAKWSKAGE